jgi:hypothetical protein
MQERPPPRDVPTRPIEKPHPRRTRVLAWGTALALSAACVGMFMLPSRRITRGAARHAMPIPAEPSPPPALAQPRGGQALRGRVSNEKGSPVQGARVHLSAQLGDQGYDWEAVTNDAGTFAIADLPLTAFLLEVLAEGHDGLERSVTSTTPQPLELALVRQGEVALGVQGCDVAGQAFLTGPSIYPPAERTIDARGEALFLGLAAGTYTAHVRCGERSARGTNELNVVAGARVRAAVEVRRGPELRVRVLDEDTAAPIAHALVEARDAIPGLPALRARTDGQGEANLTGLWPGALQLDIRHPEYAPSNLFRELLPGQEATLDVLLVGAAHLHGSVVDELGRPLASALLTLMAADGEGALHSGPSLGFAPSQGGELGVTLGPVPPIPKAQTAQSFVANAAGRSDNLGAFDLPGIAPQPLRLRVSVPGYADATQDIIDLRPHETRQVAIRMEPAGSLRGSVRDAQGAPIAGVHLRVRDATGVERSAMSNAAGEFEVLDLLGAFVVEGHVTGMHITSCSSEALGRAVARCEMSALALEPARHCRIEDVHSLPLGGASVSLIDAKGAEIWRSASADDGSVSLQGMPGTPLRIRVHASGYADAALLVQDDAEEPCRVRLVRAGDVSGFVVDATGRGVPHAQVTGPEGLPSTRTGRDGSFILAGLATGPARISAHHDQAGGGTSSELRVRPGERLPVGRIVLDGRYLAADPPEDLARAKHVNVGLAIRGADVVVTSLAAGGPAARLGLQVGDVLLNIDGETVLSVAQARGMLRTPLGSTAALRIRRRGAAQTLRVRRNGDL